MHIRELNFPNITALQQSSRPSKKNGFNPNMAEQVSQVP